MTKNNVSGWLRPTEAHRLMAAPYHLGGDIKSSPQSKGFAVAAQSDMSSIMPEVVSQGAIGSCTANGWAEVMEACLAKYSRPPMRYSRLFFYAGEREKIEHIDLWTDSGATITDGAMFGQQYGCCPEPMWPYDNPEQDYAEEPPKPCWDEALNHTIKRCYSLSDPEWMKACLTIGFPIVFGTEVFYEFEKVGKDGQLPMPERSTDQPIGGHCMVIFGHDDSHRNLDGSLGAYRVRNSWGTDWGDGGNCWISYAYIAQYADDFWSVHEMA